MIREVERQYRKGAVIALCWHAVPPTQDEPVTFQKSILSHLTDFEWNELLTPGTHLQQRWETQADVIAGYLKQLQAAGVPVLFRPYHEMNGNWFWWGGRPGPHGSSALYRMIYDRFVHVHHLDNLIWVWNVNSPSGNAGDMDLYDPGHAYADLYTIDIYGTFGQSYYDSMLRLAGNKPIALAEVGTMPSLATFAQQPRWAYFMIWSGFAEGGNSPEALQANFHAPALLTLGDPALQKWIPTAARMPSPEPVAAKASPAVRTLLTTLQASEHASLDSTSRHTMASIEEADLARDTDAATLMTQAKHVAANGSHLLVRWLPASPADLSGGGPDRALTDFEWSELLTEGTHLHARWMAEIDAAAGMLAQLEKASVAVLWDPLPGANGKDQKERWWAGRAGIYGSAALYRSVFERMASHPGGGNLAWVWTASPSGASGASAPGEYFPGLLYVDALQVIVTRPEGMNRARSEFRELGLRKPVGVLLQTDAVTAPATLQSTDGLAWLLTKPQPADSPKALP